MISTRSGPRSEDFNQGWRMWTQHTDLQFNVSPLRLKLCQVIFCICPFRTLLCYLSTNQQELSSEWEKLNWAETAWINPGLPLPRMLPAVGKLPKTAVERLSESSCNQHRQQVQYGRVLCFTATLFSISNSVPLLSKAISDKHFYKGCPSKIIFCFYCPLINTRHSKC